MSTYITSDTHFGHTNILKYTGRTRFMSSNEALIYNSLIKEPNPILRENGIRNMFIDKTSTKKMDKYMVKNWNDTVGKDDIIYHLGDFALAGADRIRQLVSMLNGYKILIVGNHDKKPRKMETYGFDEVYQGIHLHDYKLMTHVPIFIEGILTINVGVDQWGFKPIPMPKEKRIILSGHVHEKWKVKGKDEIGREFKWLI